MMRYLRLGVWHECRYSLTAMCSVILNDYPYELKGRDY